MNHLGPRASWRHNLSSSYVIYGLFSGAAFMEISNAVIKWVTVVLIVNVPIKHMMLNSLHQCIVFVGGQFHSPLKVLDQNVSAALERAENESSPSGLCSSHTKHAASFSTSQLSCFLCFCCIKVLRPGLWRPSASASLHPCFRCPPIFNFTPVWSTFRWCCLQNTWAVSAHLFVSANGRKNLLATASPAEALTKSLYPQKRDKSDFFCIPAAMNYKLHGTNCQCVTNECSNESPRFQKY